MRLPALAVISTVLLATSSPSFAQDEDAPSAVTVSGGATVVTDYRFRGISQSNKRAAIQGTFIVSHESGAYGGVWGSSVDDYIADNSAEIDFIAGYKTDVGAVTLDGGVTYYYYPNSSFPNSDFFELYGSLSHTLGPVTGKIAAIYAPKQQALSVDGINEEDNLYLSGDLSTGIPNTPVTLSAHVGHSFDESYLTFGEEYTDWSVSASYVWRNLVFTAAYVDTDADLFAGTRNVSKAGVVGSVGVSF